jgi:hypothetical protein
LADASTEAKPARAAEGGLPLPPLDPPPDTALPTPPVVIPEDENELPPSPTSDAGASPTLDASAAPVTDDGGDGSAVSQEEGGFLPLDECPDHPAQSLRGPCGCGFAPNDACGTLERSLVHRYSFEGVGANAQDSVGEAHGRVVGAELDGSGSLEMNGESIYVELPAGMMSSFETATFELWARWDGGGSNQRLLNFGTRGDNGGVPPSFLSLTPRNGDDEMAVSLRSSDGAAQLQVLSEQLPADGVRHVAVVVDGVNDFIALYLDGVHLATESTEHHLAQLEDTTNWLGRPLYQDYPLYDGALFEFRIHDVALSDDEIRISDDLGPNATFSAAPTLLP